MIGVVVPYASCYVYSPSGSGKLSERSRLLCELLKAGDARFMLRYAMRVHEQTRDFSSLAGFFHPADVLVPVPGSMPQRSGRVWVAEQLAGALLNEGLGRNAWRGLHRITSVRKSATAEPGRRPSVGSHYASFTLEAPLSEPERVVLIDDVITKGRTLLAAAIRVREALPRTDIRAFALVRTMGLALGIDQLLDPCRGEIRWRAGDADRNP